MSAHHTGNNLGILKGLTQPAESKNVKSSKGQINNLLMQLRKILQHPYLFNEDIEPRGLSAKEAHDKLIDASAKLRLLKGFLPKLKERGHRVLLFSQFSIALDILEDFLRGEGHRYLRLDGSTKNADRQKGMDEFNKPGSDIFIYLLTTRAGGVGINLFSADTVIIFDPDFNPHQDLQAIARAYRYGQQKTCLVFKLMVKESAEERIMQIGKKKLVLDHLIVQKMDDEETTSGNMESILTHGAQALFESADDSNRDINYSENDIEKLIERTEVEGDDVQEAPQGSMSFTFAKIWSADKDTMEEVEDNDQGDSWAQTLEKITEAQKKAQELEIVQSGRGARRKAAVVAQTNLRITEPVEESRVKPSTKKITSRDSDGSFYAGSQPGSDSESSGDEFALVPDPGPEERVPKRQRTGNWLGSVAQESETCAMCGQHHDDPGQCSMTESSQNLAEYREMLILHAEDEPWEQRYAAIRVIDETLYKRGDIALIVGQPLRPLRKSEPLPQPKTKQKARTG
ncbi:hypothetical protein AX16_009734 [Volvariella volvacea WC 439]|nr:hypothetical protein AX16_009734 [Volvariella volvacea WC 439]